MPELPEVEHARGYLQRWLGAATVVEVIVGDRRILDGDPRRLRALVGKRVERVTRRGKWLRVQLDGPLAFSHLGMTGKWVRVDAGAAPLRFERLRLEVRKARAQHAVVFLDPRLFGTFLVADEDIAAWSALGPDPLTDGIDVDVLHAALSRRSAPIKPALRDQALLAGVGNIQATEALFYARVDPRRPSRSLSRKEVGAIARGIDRSIRKTIADQAGTTITYVEEPGADNPFTIYGHEGEPCPRCKRPLTKIVLAGRGTVFCERCQR